MISVVLIGTGNVSQHLFNAFAECEETSVIQVVGRNINALLHYQGSTKIGSIDTVVQDADLYIIAVSDNAIPSVSKSLNLENKLTVHTSGSAALDALEKHSRRGVFYPLQTFTKGKEINFKEIPLCIEAANANDEAFLKKIASMLSNQVFSMSSDQRKTIHVAAVFANNFSNHMYYLAQQMCKTNNIPFDILKPLITETAKKIETMPPLDAQTGPARRQDTNTIASHLNLIENKKIKEMYSLLSTSIMHTYGKKL